MQKTITFISWNTNRDFDTDNLVCRVKFSVIDTALIGTPKERESIHKITIILTDILLGHWGIPGWDRADQITEEMMKVVLQSLEDYLTQQLIQASLLDDKLQPITLSTENSPKICPYKLANILYPSKKYFTVEIEDKSSPKSNSNQITINGNVFGSNIIAGNENKIQNSADKE